MGTMVLNSLNIELTLGGFDCGMDAAVIPA